MKINSLDKLNSTLLYKKDENGRQVKVFKLSKVELYKNNLHYPNIRLLSREDNETYNPIREKIMSMPDEAVEIESLQRGIINHHEKTPVFFFVYNTDNYYHFIYDTLPYLITYRELKKEHPELKLLISTPNRHQSKLNKFVLEFLNLLKISEKDLLVANSETEYETVYVSSSYTHEIDSNLPPRKEIYALYEEMGNKVKTNTGFPSRIYVSRRSHRHKNYENMGTNYTIKRRLVNEDELVGFLKTKGYTEVFTELLSTEEKINMFKGCKKIIGPIGGGLCNALFSRKDTTLTPIVSPFFLDINKRFSYSFSGVKTNYFTDTSHVEDGPFKKHMRVRIKNKKVTGEIQDMEKDTLRIIYDDTGVAGWNSQVEYKTLEVDKENVERVDPGLNSIWKMNLNKFKKDYSNG